MQSEFNFLKSFKLTFKFSSLFELIVRFIELIKIVLPRSMVIVNVSSASIGNVKFFGLQFHLEQPRRNFSFYFSFNQFFRPSAQNIKII